jgi:hypothetical protein
VIQFPTLVLSDYGFSFYPLAQGESHATYRDNPREYIADVRDPKLAPVSRIVYHSTSTDAHMLPGTPRIANKRCKLVLAARPENRHLADVSIYPDIRNRSKID